MRSFKIRLINNVVKKRFADIFKAMNKESETMATSSGGYGQVRGTHQANKDMKDSFRAPDYEVDTQSIGTKSAGIGSAHDTNDKQAEKAKEASNVIRDQTREESKTARASKKESINTEINDIIENNEGRQMKGDKVGRKDTNSKDFPHGTDKI